MTHARFITAVGTPLDGEDRLHDEGLVRHLADQLDAGIDSVLVGGTMGMMPLQTDQTWRDLLVRSAELLDGRAELLVGATDVSTSRALDRIGYVNTLAGIDGVVVMTPGYVKFTEPQYVDYYTVLADASRHLLYLYELQPLTGVRLSIDTLCTLADHPNIAGVKLSSNVPDASRLRHRLGDRKFRLIVSEPVLSDMLFRYGYAEHLDGIYAVCPHWAVAMADAVRREAWDEASVWQEKLSQIKELFLTLPFGPLFTTLMNLRGLPGFYAPRPFSRPDDGFVARLRALPIVEELLASRPARALSNA